VNPLPAEGFELLSDSLVWDMTLPWKSSYEGVLLPQWKTAQVNFVSLTMAIRGDGKQQVTQQIKRISAHINERSDLLLATSVADIRTAMRFNKLAVGLHFQETWPFEGDTELVEFFYRLGVRHALLAYNLRNLAADGCAERTDSGLSWFGVDLIKEMNRVGMLVDGTHSGYRSTMEAMELNKGPFIFSHSNPYGVYRHYRNIKDDQIEACAATGGVIGVNGLRHFLGPSEGSLAERMADCIDYISTLVGPEHVGLGLDHVPGAPEERTRALAAQPRIHPTPELGDIPRCYASADVLPELVSTLLIRKYTEKEIRGFLGLNFLRVAELVWKPVAATAR